MGGDAGKLGFSEVDRDDPSGVAAVVGVDVRPRGIVLGGQVCFERLAGGLADMGTSFLPLLWDHSRVGVPSADLSA